MHLLSGLIVACMVENSMLKQNRLWLDIVASCVGATAGNLVTSVLMFLQDAITEADLAQRDAEALALRKAMYAQLVEDEKAKMRNWQQQGAVEGASGSGGSVQGAADGEEHAFPDGGQQGQGEGEGQHRAAEGCSGQQCSRAGEPNGVPNMAAQSSLIQSTYCCVESCP